MENRRRRRRIRWPRFRRNGKVTRSKICRSKIVRRKIRYGKVEGTEIRARHARLLRNFSAQLQFSFIGTHPLSRGNRLEGFHLISQLCILHDDLAYGNGETLFRSQDGILLHKLLKTAAHYGTK